MKTFISITALAFTILLLSFFWQVWNNNRDIPPASSKDIALHFKRSIDWLEINYSNVENSRNPILWWMVKQAADISDNSRLKTIYSRYKQNHLDPNPPNLSTPMFDVFYRPNMPDISYFSALDDYQIFLFYSTSCDTDLGSEPLIQRQLLPDYCSAHFIRPRCVTHQLMGLRFMQRYQCGYDDIVSTSIEELKSTIISELTWDFRVGDAYIQRVLMLVDSDAYDRVKPVWIKNILDAQNEDGSWDDLHPIIYLSDDKILAFTSKLPTIKQQKSSFHTTAQGIWLLSMLVAKNPIN